MDLMQLHQYALPRWTKDYQRLTYDEHHIESLGSFGHCNRKTNDPPLRSHIHMNSMEVTVMLKGTQIYEVDDIVHKLYGNQIFITLPNIIHSSAGMPQIMAEFYYFQINLLDSKTILGLDEYHSSYLMGQLLKIEDYIYPGNDNINQLVADAFRNISAKDETLKQCGQSQIATLLYMLCDIAHSSPCASNNNFLQEVDNYIHLHIHEPLKIEDIASVFGYSPSYFKTKFRSDAGITPGYYIMRLKIDQSKEYLKNGKSITETAMDLSFGSSSYFSTVFHRFTSRTPSEYRQLALEGKLEVKEV